MNDNSTTKLVIEVLSENNVENLSTVIQDAAREALALDADADLDDAVDIVVTGVSPQPALDIIQYAVGEVGIDTNWNSDAFQMFKPNVDSALERLDEDDFDSNSTMERRAYRNSADFRNMLLCEGTENHAAADQFVVIADDVTHDDVDGLSAGAKGFLNSVRDHGRINDIHVAYAGVPTADDEADEADSDVEASDSESEPTDAEVEGEFEDLVA